MKRVFILTLLVINLWGIGCAQSRKNSRDIPLAPKENRKPEGYDPVKYRYKYSLQEIMEKRHDKHMKKASAQYAKVNETNRKGPWKATEESIDSHQTPEWFEDAKFGMFIDWGLWSIPGWAEKLKEKAMYPDWYELWMESDSTVRAYHKKNWGEDFRRDDFIPLFKMKGYNPEQIVEIAKEAGMRYIVPFTKHHTGFCLWSSAFTFRDVKDRGPRKDLMAPLAKACRKQNMKFGFYFSIDEWEYPIIASDGTLKKRTWGGNITSYTPDMEWKASGKVAVKDFFKDYIIPQATEFIDKYDPDLIWYDGDWNTSLSQTNATHDIAAYFYNKAEGRKEVAINDRFGLDREGKSLWLRRGDFYCSEFMQKDKEVKEGTHAWEKCRGISQSFGYNWQDTEKNVITSKQFIDMFIDIVSMGGNLLLVVNLNQDGDIPVQEKERLKNIGEWLAVNGEGIYATRRYKIPNEGSVAYTMAKDKKHVYAIMKEWPGENIVLKNVQPTPNAQIKLLGTENVLEWEYCQEGIKIKLPKHMRDSRSHPCDYAWILKIEA